LFGGPRIPYLPRSREHILPRFENKLGQQGFRVVHRRYSHFYFMQQPLANWFPRLEGRIGKFLEERRRFRPNWLASTVTVFAEKSAAGNGSPHA
jgi:hypothetical protein